MSISDPEEIFVSWPVVFEWIKVPQMCQIKQKKTTRAMALLGKRGET